MSDLPDLSESSKPKFHESFVEWLNCISDLARSEKKSLRPGGPDAWMAGPVREFGEFHTAAGLEALRKVWDRLPVLKVAGKGAIRSKLRDTFRSKFPRDNSAIIANAIWSCVLLHGEIEPPQHGMPDAEDRRAAVAAFILNGNAVALERPVPQCQ